MLLISMGGFHFGYNALITNIMSIALTDFLYKIPEENQEKEIGNLGFYFAIGTLLSSLSLGVLTKKFGRIRLLFIIEILGLVVYSLHLIKSLVLLKILRFFLGVIAGINFSLAPSICKELLPKTIGTLGGNFTWFFDVIFEFFVSFFPFIFGGNQGLFDFWRPIMAFGLLISMIRITGFLIILREVESPNFYFEKYNDPMLIKDKILKEMKIFYSEESAKIKTEKIIKHQMKMKNRKLIKKKKIGMLSLCQKHYRRRFSVITTMNILSQLTGLSFMMFFSYQLFEEINNSGAVMVIAQTAGMAIGGIIGMFAFKFKRKKSMILSYGVSAFFLFSLTLALLFDLIVVLVISMLIYITSVSFSSSVFSVYMPEVLPPFPIGVAVAFRHLMAAFIGKTSPFFLKIFGVEIMLLFFGVCCCFSCGFIACFAVESKGKSMHEVCEGFECGEKKKA